MEPTTQQDHDRPGAWGGLLGLVALALLTVPGAPLRHAAGSDPAVRIQIVTEEGAPIAGATLRWPDGRYAAQTDAAGEATVPRQGELLGAWAPGYMRLNVPLPPRPEATVRVVLRRGRTLRGLVQGPDGAPLAGATIELRYGPSGGEREGTRHDGDPSSGASHSDESDPNGGLWRAVSGADGRFVLTPLPDAPLTLRARAEGRAEARRLVLPGDDELTLILEPAAGVSGQVFASSGLASGAEVRLVGSGIWPPRVATTDAHGRFRFGEVPAGIYEIHARSGDEAAPPVQGLSIAEGEAAFVTLRLRPAHRLTGQVTDERGEPIAGAQVSVRRDGVALLSFDVTTDTRGRFRVDGLLPGPWWVTARAPGHLATSAETVVPGDLALVLTRGATVEGRVVDERDRPVAGATVLWLGPATAARPTGDGLGVVPGPVPPIPLDALTSAGPAPTLVASGARTVTGPDGRFVLESIPPGLGEVHVEAPGLAPARSAMRLAPGERVRALRLTTPDGASLEGRVVDERGFPLASILVELRCELEPWPRSLVAGDDGTFRFEGVVGVAVLTARPADLPPARLRVEGRSGERLEVELRVPSELHQLAVRVFDPEGFPVADAEVELRSRDPRSPLVRRGRTAADGTFVFAALPPPPYQLSASHPDFVQRDLGEVADPSSELRIVLPRGGALHGRVVDAWSLEPLDGVELRAEADEGPARVTTSGVDGSYVLERLPLGRYQLRASGPGLLEATRSIELRQPLTRVPDWPLAAAARLVGEVVDVLGDPVPDARVTADDGTAARSAADGTFRLELPAGVHVLEASHPSAGRARSAPVRVDAGEERSLRLVTNARVAEPSHERVPSFVVGVPVEVERRGDEVVVTQVHGSGVGLRPSDVLLAIDGEPVLAASQARALLRGPAGVSASVRLRRGGRVRTVDAPRLRHARP